MYRYNMKNRENRKYKFIMDYKKKHFHFLILRRVTPLQLTNKRLPRVDEKFLDVGRVRFRNYNNHKRFFYISFVIFFIAYAFVITISFFK